MGEWTKLSVDLIVIIGSIAALNGTIELCFMNNRDSKWQGTAFKIFGGFAALGLGLLIRHFGRI